MPWLRAISIAGADRSKPSSCAATPRAASSASSEPAPQPISTRRSGRNAARSQRAIT
jgi:hypothetical protein